MCQISVRGQRGNLTRTVFSSAYLNGGWSCLESVEHVLSWVYCSACLVRAVPGVKGSVSSLGEKGLVRFNWAV